MDSQDVQKMQYDNTSQFHEQLKTPERSRTSRDPQLYSPFAPKSFCLLRIERHTQINYVMSRDVMTSYHDVM